MYVYSANTLTLDADILPSAGAAQAKFGYSLAIFQGVDQFNTPESDLPQWLSIGAPGANKVYVYNKASSTSAWAVSDVVNAPLGLGASEFGRAVSWHTDYMVSFCCTSNYLYDTLLIFLLKILCTVACCGY